jgi:hypothetical protein
MIGGPCDANVRVSHCVPVRFTNGPLSSLLEEQHVSQLPSRAPRRAATSLWRAVTRITLFAAVLLGIAGTTPALSQAADATVTQADLCAAWSLGASNPEIVLSSGLKITGSSLQRSGASCTAPDASLSVANSAITEVTPSAGGNAASRALASITRELAASANDLKVGDEVFKGAVIRSLTTQIQVGYLGIRGGVEIQWTGGTVTKLQFTGKLYGVNRYSMTLSSPADGTKLPNIGGDAIKFSGDLVRDSSGTRLNLTGTAPSIVIGEGDKQLTLANGALKLTLADEQTGAGLKLAASGSVTLGGAVKLSNASVNALFDDAGLLSFQGAGALDVKIPAKGSSPAGSITGNAQVAFQRGGAQSVTFTGDARFGEVLVAGAAGSLDAQSVSFTGNVELSNAELTVRGGVDGVAFYGDDLAGRTVQNRAGAQVAAQKGDALVKSVNAHITAKGLTLKGNAQIGDVGNEQWAKAAGDVDLAFDVQGQPTTTIQGSAELDWLKGQAPAVSFRGTVASGSTSATGEGVVDGTKLSLKGTAKLSNPDLTVEGAVDGVVYYGGGSADMIADRSGAQVAAQKGDFVLRSASASISSKGFELTGTASMARVGGSRWASGSGDVDLSLGQTSLKGKAAMTWSAGDVPAVTFSGSMSQGSTAVANVEGSVDGSVLRFKGDGTLNVNGLAVKGAVDGTLFYGANLAGQTITGRDGKPVQASKGDYVLKSLSGDVVVKSLALGGNVSLGSIGGVQWANAGGTVDVTSGATHIVGSADLAWTEGDNPTVNFTGTLTNATTTVAHATGTIDGKKITLKGDATLTDPTITLSGAVDGTVYYGDPAGDTLPNASGTPVTAQKGDYLLKTASGAVTVKNLAVTGEVSLGNVAGSRYAKGGGTVDVTSGATRLQGMAGFTWTNAGATTATFSGTVTAGNTTVANASGTLDGRKLIGRGDASVREAAYSASGALSGVVYYGDPAGDKLQGPTGALLAAKKGDWLLKSASGELTAKGVTLTGNISAGVVGGIKWVKGAGAIDTSFGSPATTIKGSATFTWAASGSGTLTFDGSVTSAATTITGKGTLDGKKIALTGTVTYSTNDLAIQGAVDGTVYYGDPAGDTLPNAAGTLVAAQKGDYVVKSASGAVTVKNLALTGAVSLGKVAGTQWASGGGSVDLTSGATNLKGSATFDWATGKAAAVTFTGTVTSGTTTVASASGAIDGKKIALKGTATITEAAYALTGSIDGVVYYGDPAGDTIADRSGAQVAAAKGDYVLKSAAGALTAKGVTLSGNVSAGKAGGSQWAAGAGAVQISGGSPVTTIKGSATFTWASGSAGSLAFDGTVTQADTAIAAKGVMDGKKLLFSGSLTSPTLSGAAAGGVYYGADLTGETIVNRSGTTVGASKGDLYVTVTNGKVVLKQLTATANFTLKKVGAVTWVKTDAQIKVGTTWLTFAGEIDSAGNVNLQGAGSVVLDGYTVNFNGSAVIQDNALTLTGTVDVVTSLYGVRLTGTITKADMNSSAFTFVGSAGFRFGGYTVTGATVRFTTGEGITTAFDIKYCLLVVCTTGTYKLYFTGGEITRIQLNSPIASWPAFFAIAKITAPSIPVETTITGLL